MINTREDWELALSREEELDPELQPFLFYDKVFGDVLKHPLVYSIPHGRSFNALVNIQYRMKNKRYAEAFANGDWELFIALHERPYRIYALSLIAHKITDATRYWDLVRESIIDSENLWQELPKLRKLLKRKDGREMLMADRSLEVLKDRMDGDSMLMVYRGCTLKNRRGISWTLNGTVAKWFALRFKDPGESGLVLVGKCHRDKIYAYFEERGEEEILVEPRYVEVIRVDYVRKEENLQWN